MTTVSSTSSFCRRRRRRRLLGRQAAGRGTTFGAGCAARRAASAPSPPHHLLSARAHSAPSVGRCTGTSWPDLGVRAQLHRSARASRRAAKGARAQVEGKWIVGSRSVLRRAWSRPQRGGGARPRARRGARRGRELKGVRASTLKRLGCSQLGSRCPRVRARARGERSSDVATCAFFLRAREPKFSFRQRFVQDPPRPSLTDRPTRSGFSPAPRGSAGDRQRLPSWLQPCCARLFQGPQDICVQATLQSQFRACPNAPSSQ